MCAVQTIQQGNLLFVRLAPLQQLRRHLETEAGVDNAIKSGLKGNGDDGWEWTFMHYVWCLVFSIPGFTGYNRGRSSAKTTKCILIRTHKAACILHTIQKMPNQSHQLFHVISTQLHHSRLLHTIPNEQTISIPPSTPLPTHSTHEHAPPK